MNELFKKLANVFLEKRTQPNTGMLLLVEDPQRLFRHTVHEMLDSVPKHWDVTAWQVDPDTYKTMASEFWHEWSIDKDSRTFMGYPVQIIRIETDNMRVPSSRHLYEEKPVRDPIVLSLVCKSRRTGRIRYHDHPVCDSKLKD